MAAGKYFLEYIFTLLPKLNYNYPLPKTTAVNQAHRADMSVALNSCFCKNPVGVKYNISLLWS